MRESRRRWAALFFRRPGGAMIIVDATIVTVRAPRDFRGLGVPSTDAEWLPEAHPSGQVEPVPWLVHI